MNERHLDPVTMARFMVMPGAVDVVEALAAIPEGEIRNASIAQLQAIARQYQRSEPMTRATDPLHIAAEAAGRTSPPDHRRPAAATKGALPSPDLAPHVVQSKEVRAVQLLMEGVKPPEVAKQLKMKIERVMAARRDAKKAGMDLPNIRQPREIGSVRFIRYVSEADGDEVVITNLKRGATARGIGLDEYLARRRAVVDMAKAGHQTAQISEVTGEEEKAIVSWLARARASGIKIPYAIPPALVEPATATA